MNMNQDSDSCEDVLQLDDFDPDTQCPPSYDSVFCWPATLINTTAFQYCAENTQSQAYRDCLPNGQWDDFSNYSSCFGEYDLSTHHYNETDNSWNPQALRDAEIQALMMFVGSLTSVVLLVISLVIFHWFKPQQCERTCIHRNLILSFILRFIIVVVTLEPYVFKHQVWYKSVKSLCRSLITLEKLSYVANFCWMLVEGLYLHIILVLRPLSSEKVPFLIFYAIGWVIPLLVAVVWAVVMHFDHDSPCWSRSSSRHYIFIIYAPIMLALFINLLILVNLVRIIILKLCAGHSAERSRICRTIKSTIVLVFLLGIINLLFVTGGNASFHVTRVYRYIYAILPNCQGIFVAAIYCGFNAEVRRNIRKSWRRFVDTRNLYGSALKNCNSRASVSTYVSRPTRYQGAETRVVEMQSLRDSLSNGNSV